MDEDLAAIVRRTVARFRDIATEHAHNQQRLNELYKATDQLNERQSQLQALANRCYSTAELFGFDLASELARAPAGPLEKSGPIIDAIIDLNDAEIQKPPTVKEFILERARLAFPNPVRAAGLRRDFEEISGKAVHDKTFGMSLYRLSQEGAMKREGAADWYFVPEDQRVAAPPSETAEDDTGGLF